mmetsp:Transcript_17092/g.37389  ORF Transcript_17092/g.37389 Transcript_17092/m.37389 type:complete len:218 (-) Transcript_17092:808-1461(-)
MYTVCTRSVLNFSAFPNSSDMATCRKVPPPTANKHPTVTCRKSTTKISRAPTKTDRPKTKLTRSATNGFMPHWLTMTRYPASWLGSSWKIVARTIEIWMSRPHPKKATPTKMPSVKLWKISPRLYETNRGTFLRRITPQSVTKSSASTSASAWVVEVVLVLVFVLVLFSVVSPSRWCASVQSGSLPLLVPLLLLLLLLVPVLSRMPLLLLPWLWSWS